MQLHLKDITQNLFIVQKNTHRGSEQKHDSICDCSRGWIYGLRKVNFYLKASASSHLKKVFFIPFPSPRNFMRIKVDNANDIWAKCQVK